MGTLGIKVRGKYLCEYGTCTYVLSRSTPPANKPWPTIGRPAIAVRTAASSIHWVDAHGIPFWKWTHDCRAPRVNTIPADGAAMEAWHSGVGFLLPSMHPVDSSQSATSAPCPLASMKQNEAIAYLGIVWGTCLVPEARMSLAGPFQQPPS